MDDPADLSHLADIAVPAPVPWWPPAPGWWILGAALLAALALAGAAVLVRHRRNAYRRSALAALDAIGPASDAARVRAVSAVLKRAALAAYPRGAVAGLTGAAWLAFLSRTPGTQPLAGLEAGAYGGPAVDGVSGDGVAITAAARRWVKRHRAVADAEGG